MTLIDTNAMNKKVLAFKKARTQLRAEEVREKLDPEALIDALTDLVIEANTVKVEEIPRLKFQADVITTILKKCMPDLRSLEVKANESKYTKLIIEGEVELNKQA